MPFDVPLHKTQDYVWLRGWDFNRFQEVLALSVPEGSGGRATPGPINRTNINIYGLVVGFSTVFKIVGNFLFKGGGGSGPPRLYDLHTI